MSLLFGNFLKFLVDAVLYVPFTVLRVVGLALPACSEYGLVAIPSLVTEGMVRIIKLLWPILQFVPWAFLWNFGSAWVLFLIVKWVIGHLPWLTTLGSRVWVIVLVLYVLSGIINFFIGTDWQTSDVFLTGFGLTPDSVGGAFGGGGGGRW